jgi:hypothetical protein
MRDSAEEPDEPETTDAELRPETPEADALEQRRPAAGADTEAGEPASLPADAAEADALDQLSAVPFDDEDREG